MRIGVDLDGVCYDFVASVQSWLTEHNDTYTIDQLPAAETWDFFKYQWGMTTDEFLSHCAEGVDGGVVFRRGTPEPGCRDALAKLRAAGHSVHIVTNRSYGTRSVQNTGDWLAAQEIPYDTLTFAADKTVVPVDVFIEDNVDNAEALWKAGVGTWLYDRPWNQHSDLSRVHSWEEFLLRVMPPGDDYLHPGTPEHDQMLRETAEEEEL